MQKFNECNQRSTFKAFNDRSLRAAGIKGLLFSAKLKSSISAWKLVGRWKLSTLTAPLQFSCPPRPPSVNPSKSREAFAHIRCVRILRVNRMSEICFITFSPSFIYIVHFIQNRYSAVCECYLDFLISLRKHTINVQFSRILFTSTNSFTRWDKWEYSKKCKHF